MTRMTLPRMRSGSHLALFPLKDEKSEFTASNRRASSIAIEVISPRLIGRYNRAAIGSSMTEYAAEFSALFHRASLRSLVHRLGLEINRNPSKLGTGNTGFEEVEPWMRFEKMITAVDSHTEGMPTRVVTSGFGPIPGKTMFEKKQYVEEHLDNLRTLLMFEPRGHGSMSGSIILPPVTSDGDLGVVFIEVSGCLPMCGHGTIGTCTVAIETGLVKVSEPVTYVKLDTPAGRVVAEAGVQNGRVKKVKIKNVPSFLYRKDVSVDVPTIGNLTLDIAYGGNFYGILPVDSVALSLDKKDAQLLIDAGMKIMKSVREQVPLRHPLNTEINEIKHIMFTGPADIEGANAKNTVVIHPGTFDRSPCGTGTSARMAQLYFRGKLGLNQDFIHESLIGRFFTGRLVDQVQLTPDIPAVVPTIEGRAWISGFQNLVLDPEDPFPAGFLVNA